MVSEQDISKTEGGDAQPGEDANVENTPENDALHELYGRPIMPGMDDAQHEDGGHSDAANGASASGYDHDDASVEAADRQDGSAERDFIAELFNIDSPDQQDPSPFAPHGDMELQDRYGVLDLPERVNSLSAATGAAASEYLSDPASNVIPFHYDDGRDSEKAFASSRTLTLPEPQEGAGEEIGALADAVQNALRNIYGAEAAAPALGNASNQLVRTPGADPDGMGPFAPQNWSAGPAGMFDDTRGISAAELDDSTTEAVLSYLYQSENPAPSRAERSPSLHALDDLRDAVERNQRESTTWPADAAQDATAAAGGQAVERHETPYYRGGALRSPQSKPLEDGLETYYRGEAGAAPPYRDGGLSGQKAIVASPPPVEPSSPERDSGRLLGAAGLGLIGGIALAGVLSVFLFNSVVTNPEFADNTSAVNINPSAAPAQEKVVARLLDPAVNDAALASGLRVADVSGAPGQAIDLKIEFEGPVRENALVSLRGVPQQAQLSAGVDVGGGVWLLPLQRLVGLQMNVKGAVSGDFRLETQVMQSDARTPLSAPKSFTLSLEGDGAVPQDSVKAALAAMQGGSQAGAAENSGEAQAPQTTAAAMVAPTRSAPATDASDSVQPNENPGVKQSIKRVVLQSSDPQRSNQQIREGNRLMREGDITAARKLYDEAVTLGDPDAFLAMGRSYDPSYFEQLSVKTGKPDPAQAFDWYMKALDNGVETAKVKIDSLRQWLLR